MRPLVPSEAILVREPTTSLMRLFAPDVLADRVSCSPDSSLYLMIVGFILSLPPPPLQPALVLRRRPGRWGERTNGLDGKAHAARVRREHLGDGVPDFLLPLFLGSRGLLRLLGLAHRCSPFPAWMTSFMRPRRSSSGSMVGSGSMGLILLPGVEGSTRSLLSRRTHR